MPKKSREYVDLLASKQAQHREDVGSSNTQRNAKSPPRSPTTGAPVANLAVGDVASSKPSRPAALTESTLGRHLRGLAFEDLMLSSDSSAIEPTHTEDDGTRVDTVRSGAGDDDPSDLSTFATVIDERFEELELQDPMDGIDANTRA